MWTKKAVNLDAEAPKWASGQRTEKSGRIKVPKQHRGARVQEGVYGFRKRGVNSMNFKREGLLGGGGRTMSQKGDEALATC